MTNDKNDPFYFFLHTPKAAGTTLRSIVDLQLGRKCVLTYYNQPNRHLLDNLDAHLKMNEGRYKALIGHFEFGPHDGISQSSKYVTFFRDPVRRTISSYFENLKTRPDLFEDKDGSIMSLEQSFQSMPGFFANQQTKMICGNVKDDTATQDDLDSAKANLEKYFLLAGITELFNESILILSKQLGWRPCLYRRLNKGANRPEISVTVKELATNLNQLDQQLYEYALSQLRNRIEEYGTNFAKALLEVESTLSIYDSEGTADAEFTNVDIPAVMRFLSK